MYNIINKYLESLIFYKKLQDVKSFNKRYSG